MPIGHYHPDYNRKVHGPYDPARWYGKPDTALLQVKIGELPAWLSRRSFAPSAVIGSISRGYWRWCHKFVFPYRANYVALFQIMVAASVCGYYLNFAKYYAHRTRKYH